MAGDRAEPMNLLISPRQSPATAVSFFSMTGKRKYLVPNHLFRTVQLIHTLATISLKRRYSSRTFRYGYLVTT